VQLHNVFMSEHHLCAVLDWASAGSLAAYADKYRGESRPGRFPDSIRWDIHKLFCTLLARAVNRAAVDRPCCVEIITSTQPSVLICGALILGTDISM
jgi:hypothetical protein